MSPAEHEAAIMDQVQADLAANGYRVVVQPDRLALPEFLRDLRPDAIAFGPLDNLVVEILQRSPSAESKLSRFRDAIIDKPDWRLHAVWTSGGSAPRSQPIQTKKAVSESLQQAEELLAAGFVRPSFLLCWAILEAAGRALLPDRLSKPQTPARLVEQLEASGFLNRNQGARLRAFGRLRNQIVHGDLVAMPTAEDVEVFLNILRELHKTRH